jgi:hypothetical protein
MPEKLPSNRPDYSLLSKAWNMGIAIVLLTLSGHWLDQKFHTSDILTLVGAFLGILYSLYEVWAALNRK